MFNLTYLKLLITVMTPIGHRSCRYPHFSSTCRSRFLCTLRHVDLTDSSLTISMLTRLFLNLREAALDPDFNVSSASSMSDPRFAHVLGHIDSDSGQGTAQSEPEPLDIGDISQSSIEQYTDRDFGEVTPSPCGFGGLTTGDRGDMEVLDISAANLSQEQV